MRALVNFMIAFPDRPLKTAHCASDGFVATDGTACGPRIRAEPL